MSTEIILNGIRCEVLRDKGNESSFGDAPKWVVVDRDTHRMLYVKSRIKPTSLDIESEVIASRLASLLQLNAVIYDKATVVLDNEKVSVCISEDYAKGKQQSSIAKALRCNLQGLNGKDKFNVVAEFIDKIEPFYLDKLLIFDYIINNTDRHLNNIVFLTGDDEVKMSPIFDNGSSLFYDNTNEDIKDSLKNNITYRRSKPFYSNHTEQIKLVRDLPSNLLPKIHKEDVYKIVNQVLDGDRAKLICKWLISRLKELNLLCVSNQTYQGREQIIGQYTIRGF